MNQTIHLQFNLQLCHIEWQSYISVVKGFIQTQMNSERSYRLELLLPKVSKNDFKFKDITNCANVYTVYIQSARYMKNIFFGKDVCLLAFLINTAAAKSTNKFFPFQIIVTDCVCMLS